MRMDAKASAKDTRACRECKATPSNQGRLKRLGKHPETGGCETYVQASTVVDVMEGDHQKLRTYLTRWTYQDEFMFRFQRNGHALTIPSLGATTTPENES